MVEVPLSLRLKWSLRSCRGWLAALSHEGPRPQAASVFLLPSPGMWLPSSRSPLGPRWLREASAVPSSRQMRRKERKKSSKSSYSFPSCWPQIDNVAIFSYKVGREMCSFGLGVSPRVLLPRKKGVPLAVSLWYRRYIKNDMEWLKIKGWTKLFRQTSTKRKQGWQ